MRKIPLTERQARLVLVIIAGLATLYIWFASGLPVWVQVAVPAGLAVIALLGVWGRSRP